jgi:hypothetical protein
MGKCLKCRLQKFCKELYGSTIGGDYNMPPCAAPESVELAATTANSSCDSTGCNEAPEPKECKELKEVIRLFLNNSKSMPATDFYSWICDNEERLRYLIGVKNDTISGVTSVDLNTKIPGPNGSCIDNAVSKQRLEKLIARINENFLSSPVDDACVLSWDDWQNLKTAVLAQWTNKKQDTPCIVTNIPDRRPARKF